ncbi:hypothetical protein CDAR_271941 [Caerostris darwini]|uniref:Uncharacterized protein n=1 Tax=Caerostris darwini TaxID=1538125 RepID=A0AAV4W6R0_9ARAC|nr:hypothetical protein CDAR_271941 [Caerostris darwini]
MVQAVSEEEREEESAVRPGGVRGVRGEPTPVRAEPLAAPPGGAQFDAAQDRWVTCSVPIPLWRGTGIAHLPVVFLGQCLG